MSTPRGGRPTSWTGEAPAKVNLFLRVLAREEGGHHQLETLFQALELSDRVTVSEGAREEGGGESAGAPPVSLQLSGVPAEALGPPRENLVVRAARLVLEAVGEAHPGIHIHLEKRIPHGAGLGGGSSDAANALRGVNAILGDPLSLSELVELGGRLGADVPFFLGGSPLALAWGRGDRLLALPSLPQASVLLALPPWGVATPEAYRALAARREATGGEPVAGRQGRGGVAGARLLGVFGADGTRPWAGWDDVASQAENAFEDALFPLYPEIFRIREALAGAGARVALLSGSGSAVFGLFPGVESLPEALLEDVRARAGVEGLRLLPTRTREGT